MFVGGCTADAVAAVCGGSLEGLAALLRHNLLRTSADGRTGATFRLAMLDTIRAYACEQLASSGEWQELVSRHTTYYLALSEEWRGGLLPALGRLAGQATNQGRGG